MRLACLAALLGWGDGLDGERGDGNAWRTTPSLVLPN
jgi:hypothetical protein